MAWDKALQPIFDAKCVSCHGDNNTAGIAAATRSPTRRRARSSTWTFNLSDKQPLAIDYGMDMLATCSASYLSLAGPDMEAIEKNNLMVDRQLQGLHEPAGLARLGADEGPEPDAAVPAPNQAVRAFTTTPHSQAQSYTELTPTEFYKLILATDMGANYYARENNPHSSNY